MEDKACFSEEFWGTASPGETLRNAAVVCLSHVRPEDLSAMPLPERESMQGTSAMAIVREDYCDCFTCCLVTVGNLLPYTYTPVMYTSQRNLHLYTYRQATYAAVVESKPRSHGGSGKARKRRTTITTTTNRSYRETRWLQDVMASLS